MSSISADDSSSITTLFSSLGNKNNSTSPFSSINFGEYAAIRNGSYKKLLTAYYAKQNASSTDETDKTDKAETTVSGQKINAAKVRDAAADVVDAQKELDKDSLWKKTTKTDKDGNTTTDYDKDAIYKAVSSFVEDYNSLVSAAGSSSDNSVLRTGTTIASYTKANKNLLASVGITIGSNNKLTVDESELKNADMSTVQSLFNGSGSYGKTVASSAASAYSSAVSQLAKLNSVSSYSSTGSYSYISGSVYDTFL